MTLASRNKFKSSEDFRDQFISTITPGVIPRSGFIQWDAIGKKITEHKKHLTFFQLLAQSDDSKIRDELRDSLLSSDEAFYLIQTAFQLLGHTGDRFVTDVDLIDFNALAESDLDEKRIGDIAALLIDLGITTAIRTDLEDYFLGVQVGLETHRRKNVGGAAFRAILSLTLNAIVKSLIAQGFSLDLTEEEKIFYSDGKTSKTVDFCIKSPEHIIGIEANFYTASGSKPTEIKRSYGQVNQQLERINALLVWVTDGIGYMSMQRSLKEAHDIHKNIYNFRMLKENFENDLKVLLSSDGRSS